MMGASPARLLNQVCARFHSPHGPSGVQGPDKSRVAPWVTRALPHHSASCDRCNLRTLRCL